MFLHRWTVYEDIVVCSYAMDRKTDAKSIKKASIYLGISQNRAAYRMSNFTKLCKDPRTDWHCSRQERKVFDWFPHCEPVKPTDSIIYKGDNNE